MVPNRSCRFITLFLAGFGINLLLVSISLARLINYEKDPDLAMAMKYDAEYNGGDLTLASQSRAEEYYLRYLEKCTESSQRAKVYCQLGVLFATNWHAQNGEQPDYEKSTQYMKKVLEEEPTRIGTETKRARAFLVTPGGSREEHMVLRMEHYEWLLKTEQILDAADSSSDIWLPDVPGKPLSDGRIAGIKGVFEDSLSVAASNLVGCAYSFPDPIDKMWNLQRIIDRFPDTDAAKGAASRLSVVREKMQRSVVTELNVDAILEQRPKGTQPSPSPDLENLEADRTPEKAVDASVPRGMTTSGYSVMAITAFVLALSAFHVARRTHRRKAKSQRS